MKHLFLEDLKKLDEASVKAHLAEEYGKESGDKAKIAKYLEDYHVLIAYESVAAWDYAHSASYFLFQHKKTGKYQEVNGSHCPCCGFEGQFEPQEATIEYLKSDRFVLDCGGYDDNPTKNQKEVTEFIASLALALPRNPNENPMKQTQPHDWHPQDLARPLPGIRSAYFILGLVLGTIITLAFLSKSSL